MGTQIRGEYRGGRAWRGSEKLRPAGGAVDLPRGVATGRFSSCGKEARLDRMKRMVSVAMTGLAMGCSGCGPAAVEEPAVVPMDARVQADVSGERALAEVRALVALGLRDSGTPGAEQAANHLLERFRAIGVSAEIQEFRGQRAEGGGGVPQRDRADSGRRRPHRAVWLALRYQGGDAGGLRGGERFGLQHGPAAGTGAGAGADGPASDGNPVRPFRRRGVHGGIRAERRTAWQPASGADDGTGRQSGALPR
jgi:hypothetical protein